MAWAFVLPSVNKEQFTDQGYKGDYDLIIQYTHQICSKLSKYNCMAVIVRLPVKMYNPAHDKVGVDFNS